MKKSSMSLTQGNPVRLIVIFALPILLGQIFQNLYHSADSIVVGRFVSTTALAAVSASGDISHLLVGFFTGLSTGAGVLFSRYFGAKDEKNLHASIHTAIAFAAILGLAMAALGIIFTPLLLRLVACPDDVFKEATQYLRIYLVGILFTSLYNVGAGVLRAVGDSKNPLYYLIISSLANIVLDIAFVAWFKMGVSGAALATVISQFISMAMVYIKMLRTDDVYKLVLRDLKIDGKLLLKVLDLGLPAAIQTCIISFSNLFVQRYINSFGSAAMAGIGAAKKIDRFAGMVGQSVGLASTTYVSQNVGAGNMKRAFQGVRVCLLISLGFVAVLGTTIYYCAPTLIKAFTTDEAAMAFGVSMTRTMMPFYAFQALNSIFANAVRGFGKSKVVMIMSVLGMVGCRQLFLAISMAINYSVINVYVGFPVGWACAGVSTLVYYLLAIRRKYNKQQLQAV